MQLYEAQCSESDPSDITPKTEVSYMLINWLYELLSLETERESALNVDSHQLDDLWLVLRTSPAFKCCQ